MIYFYMVAYEPKKSNPDQQTVKPLKIGNSYTDEVVSLRSDGLPIVKHGDEKIQIVGCRPYAFKRGEKIPYVLTRFFYGMYRETKTRKNDQEKK